MALLNLNGFHNVIEAFFSAKIPVFTHCYNNHQLIRQGAIHKVRLQEEGGRWSKKFTFCKLLYHRKCKWSGEGGQKKPNFVNVVCERPLTI